MSNPFELIDLASENFGGSVIYANDDFFAEKENLVKASAPIFIDGKYTDRGKWMDGWESRRRRVPGHDFSLVRLGLPGIVRAVNVDTSHFKGNFPQACRIEGCNMEGHPTVDELMGESVHWVELLPRTDLKGDTHNLFNVKSHERVTHLRFHIFPDGGVARLRVHGEVFPHLRWAGKPEATVDLAAAENGALVIGANDMFFGSRNNLIRPGRSVNMGDGWETKRSRKEAPDYCIVRLASEGKLERVELDTNHFKGNFPESAEIHGIVAPHDASFETLAAATKGWEPVLARVPLQAHTRHYYEEELLGHGPFTHLRLRIYPDGGISRLRVHGHVTEKGRSDFGLAYLNALPKDRARAAFETTLASPVFADEMIEQRPFKNIGELARAAKKASEKLQRKDWLKAFAAHPRIGEKPAGKGTHSKWAGGEQAKVSDANDATKQALAKVNRAYEKKFGHVYLVFASGRTGEELLAIAKERINNSARAEFERAKEEQLKITDLRLKKLVGGV